MKSITVTPFDIRKGAFGRSLLPWRVKVFDTARAAHEAVRSGKADIALVNMEALCRDKGLSAAENETDATTFARWGLALDSDTPDPEQGTRRLSTSGKGPMDIHTDGKMVFEIVRLNSATLFCSPMHSHMYERRQYNSHSESEDAIVTGKEKLYCVPAGYAVIFNGLTLHDGPAKYTHANVPITGPHLPAEGQSIFGRVRSWKHAALR